ncbi:MAG: diguanylate cyclase (GGDEF)-like protein [Candidatus Endobugula sp.]|jgi:diguanylate cyclase (GGDEF)-like protein
MNSAITSFRLIIVHDSPKEAQRLSSMFHNSGKPCRAQHINAEANLNKILEDQNWDLLITHDSSESLSPAVVIRNIRKFERDVPVILLTDEEGNKPIVDGMKLGACDVCQVDDDQHLLLIVSRELANRQQRKATRITQRKLKEVERRNQKLLNSSRDGIAFIQDGMYLYANDSFAEMLGYQNRDEIEFMPIMDNIIPAEQTQVKKTLKDFSLQKDSTKTNQLIFTTLLPNGQEKSITTELFIGEYEEESCTQLICHAEDGNQELIEAELKNIKHTDSLTGLYNRGYLIEGIEKTLDHVAKNETSKSLIFLDVDRFSKKIEQNYSINDADKVLKKIVSVISKHYADEDFIARVSDHSFAIISDQHDPEKLLDHGSKLCKKFSDILFEIGNKTVQFTLSIGVCLINENTTDSQTLIHHALQSIETLRKTQDGNGTNLYQRDADESEILAGNFKQALENNDFSLLFQPILSLRGGETERYEVLLRMIIDEKQISPTQFLNIAAGLNLSKKVDRWVLLEAIKFLQKNIKNKKQTQLYINLTSKSLCDSTLLPWLKVAIDASSIKASNIILQAKEADIVQHLSAVKKFTEAARAIGIEFSISNFGCSSVESLSILDHIDAKYIKLDGALSQELQENSDNTQTLETLITALHEKDKITTIPHVEKASILSKLWQLGVHCIQGNYLQPPSPEMDYEFSSEE